MEDAPDVRRWAPGVSRELAAFVAKAMARQPGERFQSAEEMIAALAKVGGVAPKDPHVLRRRARIRLFVAATVAMLAGAIITLLAVALVGRWGTLVARPRARPSPLACRRIGGFGGGARGSLRASVVRGARLEAAWRALGVASE